MIVFFARNCVTIICLVLFSYLVLSKLHFIDIYAYRLVCIFAMSFMVIILWRNEFMFFLIIYVSSCFFNSFELFVTVQRWIGHGCTLQKGHMPIFVESLTNSFKLPRTMQEMRRHS